MNIGPFELEACHAVLNGNATREQWEQAIAFAVYVQRHSPWWIGDIVQMGEERFGENFYQAMPEASDGLVSRSVGVCKKVPRSVRVEGLSFSHHREVCGLLPSQQRIVLQEALDKGLTSGEVRGLVQKKKKGIRG